MKILKIASQYKFFYLFLFIFIILISIIRINLIKDVDIANNKEYILEVINIKYQNNRYIIELKGQDKYISYSQDFPYDIGDILKIRGTLSINENNTIPNTFNYKDYLKIRGIFYELKISEITYLKRNNSIMNVIKRWLNNCLNNNIFKEYLYAFILGDTSYLDDDIKEKLQFNGIAYLLILGSFKVRIMTFLLEKIKRKCRIKEKGYLVLSFFILVLYSQLLNMKISIIKSVLFYLLRRFFKYQRIKICSYNILLLTGSIILIINPFHLVNSAFYYTFMISLGFCFKKRKTYTNYFIKLISVNIFCFLFSLPLTIYYNYEFNLMSIIWGVFFIPFIHFIFFPLCILVFIFPFLSFGFHFFLSLFIDLNNLFYNFNFLSFIIRKPHIIVLIIYYFILFMGIKNKKIIILFICILFIHLNVNKIIKETKIVFFDVGQGDSIMLKLDNSVIMIDTGGNINNRNSNNIMKYLKSLGVTYIDLLILSHGDFDHMGETINLVENFKVENVIFNCGEFNDLEQELIKILDKKKIKYYSCIKELNIDKNILYFLQTKEYDNENDNSNVIYTELNGYKFMFMGDASITTEKEIMNKYNLQDIDVLKVGHHGSKTSSSKDFIDEINPNYSVISVGKNNRYGHPNKEVLENLEKSRIYRTDQDGSIMFKIKNNKLRVETCSP